MKNIKLSLAALAISSAALFSFNAFQSSSIKGTVTPKEKAISAWAISATDTFKTEVKDGAFEIMNVKPGTYSLTIDAQDPYVQTTKSDVKVEEGKSTDVGQIVLKPKE